MKHIRTARSCKQAWMLAALFLALAGPTQAGDGVIEINQAKALAGGVTPGDGEGFPVTLSQSGSYRLTGNLTLPNASTNGILIGTDHITVDLNGFAIVGPAVCTWADGPPTTTCSNTGSGSGITGNTGGFAPENITILNGTIRGAGENGIGFIFGRIERVHLISNGGGGIDLPVGAAPNGPAPGSTIIGNWAIRNGFRGIGAGERSLVEGNVANFNGAFDTGGGIACTDGCTVKGNVTHSNRGDGIFCGGLCAVTGNTANRNGGNGISAFYGTVRGNTASLNTLFGLVLGIGGYAENTSNSNGSGAVDGGVETGGNVCDNDATCP